MAEPSRLLEVLGALSLATDRGGGFPPESALRAGVVAARLARAWGADDRLVRDCQIPALLRYLGCTGSAHEGRRSTRGTSRGSFGYSSTSTWAIRSSSSRAHRGWRGARASGSAFARSRGSPIRASRRRYPSAIAKWRAVSSSRSERRAAASYLARRTSRFGDSSSGECATKTEHAERRRRLPPERETHRTARADAAASRRRPPGGSASWRCGRGKSRRS